TLFRLSLTTIFRAAKQSIPDRSNSRNDKRTDEFRGDDDEGGFHEEGGVYGKTYEGDDTVVPAKPGAKTDPLEAGMATVTPGEAADPSKK
ncbi:MAG: hypothetical protein ABIS36_25970, partial [Chryseolinea sp.]